LVFSESRLSERRADAGERCAESWEQQAEGFKLLIGY
jgi:hypothetical protein